MMTTGAQSPTGDHISESRHVLQALILQNCAYALNSETDSDFQRTAPYKERAMGNPSPSLSTMLAGKPSSLTSTRSKAIDIVLLGEIGVGKSSLINLIAREKVAGVSSDTIGCAKTAAKYTFEEKDRNFHFYDTPGLVDPQTGVEPFIDPIDTIQKLIRSLGNGSIETLGALQIWIRQRYKRVTINDSGTSYRNTRTIKHTTNASRWETKIIQTNMG